jgi:rhodanese-related sulfurtransferase
MKVIGKLLLFSWLLATGHFLNAQTINPQYKKLLENMYRKTVPLIPVAEAAKWQATAPELVFLDTREKEEYVVSHIKNALWVGYKDFDLKRLGNISRQTPIVVYCSVGYRSEKVGEKLIKAGYTNIHNLYGSLFEWFNQGHPVYNNHGDRTAAVHTYSRRWGKWLQQGKKVY